ncbi:MAG: metallophosphatase family protein [Brevinematales bacterium]|nr:metallophosphatase family protein [Brevinematales bacterium]
MKIIVLSDIHSNLEALKSILNDISKISFDLIISLGDIIGYGPDPEKCIKIIQKEGIISIKGNHERMLLKAEDRVFANDIARKAIEWTEENISTNSKIFIESLPDRYNYGEFLFVHGSPLDHDEYILRRNTAIKSIQKIREEGINFCFFGHTHIPGIFYEDGGFYYNDNIYLDKDKYYLINPGSVGQPRDRNPKTSYLIFETEEKILTFKRIEYNISRTAEKIEEAGLPIELGVRLYYGV